MFRASLVAGGFALLLTLTPANIDGDPKPSADWPQWRGPNRDNISPDKGLLKEWPKDGPPLAWKADGIGLGYATVAVAGNKIFTTGNVGNDSCIFALNRDKGDKLWSAKVGPYAGTSYPAARCTPTVDGDRVYVLGQMGDLVCLKIDGSEVWRKHMVQDFKGRSGAWKYTESVLIDGDKLICTPGGVNAIVALNKMNGDTIWKSDLNDTASYASMIVSNASGVRQYVQILQGSVVGVDAKEGKVLWKYAKFANNTANAATPIALGDQIFCTSGYAKGGALLTVSAGLDGKLAAQEEYFNQQLKNRIGGVVQVGDYIYGDMDSAGKPWCVEWKSGKVVNNWLPAANTKLGKGSASVTYADGNLYFRYENGYVALVPASPDGYQEKGVFKIPNSERESWAHPVVIGGKLYLREKDTLWVFDVKAK